MIADATRFKEDLDADSLDLYELVMELEDSYGITVSDEEAAKITTVGDAVDFVSSACPRRADGARDPQARSGGPEPTRARSGAGAAGAARAARRLPLTLRRQALTHSSWVEHRADSYGRLAFLGDSVLGLAVAEHLFSRYPRADIGRLTKMHGQAVSGRACAEVAVELGVPELLAEVGAGQDRGRHRGRGAARLRARARLRLRGGDRRLLPAPRLRGHRARRPSPRSRHEIEIASERLLDFKSALQERLARDGARVRYEVTASPGPRTTASSRSRASVNGETCGQGSGRSKKAAEQAAAERGARTARLSSCSERHVRPAREASRSAASTRCT